jgi:hypothetical protein
MPNMGYCRFENTATDLQDCWEHFDDDELSPTEERGRREIIELAVEIARTYGDDLRN